MEDFIPLVSSSELSTSRQFISRSHTDPRHFANKPKTDYNGSLIVSRARQNISSQRNGIKDVACQLFVNDGNSDPPIVRLHSEIKEFYESVQPTVAESWMRDNVVQRITAAITARWSAAKVEVFGSCMTGLYLPTSDIDIVVFGKWDHKPLHTIQDVLIQAGICGQATSRVLDNASVPILKLTDKLTRVKVDIGVNMTSGKNTAVVVQGYMKEFPAMVYLVSVIKQFLYQRDLNEVYIGGIGSYSIILLVVSFLQLQPRSEGRRSDVNYGVLLLEFFELYGLHFNYYFDGISVRGRGRYVPKGSDARNQATLYIEDPLCPENDVARSSFNIVQVRAAFSHAYSTLNREVRSVVNRGRLLPCIVQLSVDVIEYRTWIQNKFATFSNSYENSGAVTRLISTRADQDNSDANELFNDSRDLSTTNKRTKSLKAESPLSPPPGANSPLSPPPGADSPLSPPPRGTKRHSDINSINASIVKQQMRKNASK